MVIVANEYENGIEELREKSRQFKDLIKNVLIGAEGCVNTGELTKQLLLTYVLILELEKVLDNL